VRRLQPESNGTVHTDVVSDRHVVGDGDPDGQPRGPQRAAAHISTQGQFTSPRGCQGTFGSVGTAQATRIEANFTGTECQQATFTGTLVLTKE